MLVYISGSQQNDPDFREKFKAVEIDINDAGHRAINPVSFIDNLRLSSETAMEICYRLLDMADAIYLCPDWTTSLGANQEVGYARAKGLTFFTPETMTREYGNGM